jgi:hypothetical protein
MGLMQPPIQWTWRFFFQTVKWQWCEADNSLHLIVSLRKNGAWPLPILHAFKNWTGATLLLHIL